MCVSVCVRAEMDLSGERGRKEGRKGLRERARGGNESVKTFKETFPSQLPFGCFFWKYKCFHSLTQFRKEIRDLI